MLPDKDKDGNLVGIQGRSIFDDELIEEYVERDPIFTKLYGDNPDKFDKLRDENDKHLWF